MVISVAIAAALGAAGVRAFSDLIASVFLGLVLSITVQPLRRLSARRGLPGLVGTLLRLVAADGIAAALLFILVVSGMQLAGMLQDYAPQFHSFFSDLNQRLTDAGFDTSETQAVATQANPRQVDRSRH